jgi:hypothetical protein
VIDVHAYRVKVFFLLEKHEDIGDVFGGLQFIFNVFQAVGNNQVFVFVAVEARDGRFLQHLFFFLDKKMPFLFQPSNLWIIAKTAK